MKAVDRDPDLQVVPGKFYFNNSERHIGSEVTYSLTWIEGWNPCLVEYAFYIFNIEICEIIKIQASDLCLTKYVSSLPNNLSIYER